MATTNRKEARRRQGGKSQSSGLFSRGNMSLVVLGLVVAAGVFLLLRALDGGAADSSSTRFTPLYTFQTGDFHAIAFDPSNPERLVFGHHGGVLESEDGGRNWSDLVSEDSFDGMNLVFDPADPDTLYLAGHNVISRSDDGGRTWNAFEHNLPGIDLHAFAASQSTPGRFYAFALGAGIFVSENGASEWAPLAPDAPQGTHSIVELDENSLLLGAIDEGILISDDGGATWSPSRTGIEWGLIFSVHADPIARKIYAGTSNGVFVSSDSGRSWSPTSLDDAQIISVGVNPDQPDEVMAIDRSGGLYSSSDGGESWSS